MNASAPTSVPTVPAPITTTQLFSRAGLGFLWDRRKELDPGQVAILQSLWNNKKKSSIECLQTITYSLSKKKPGLLGYGRFYGTKGSLETLERECRGTLCKDYYHDIDIVNCHPVLLEQYAHTVHKKDLPEVGKLCMNREEFLKAVGGTRDEAKDEIIKIIYGAVNKIDTLGTLAAEIREFCKYLATLTVFTELLTYCKSQKEKSTYGALLSYILQTEERKCMLSMKASLESRGWSVDVLAYDGVMVRRREGADLEADMRAAEKQILVDTGYTVQLLEKHFVSYDVPLASEEIVKGITRETYTEMKTRFEETNFYYAPTNEMISVTGNQLQRMSLEHAREDFSASWRFKHSTKFEDYTPFFDVWRKDETRRRITKIQMEPSDDPSIFVMPPRFAWREQVDDDGDSGATAIQIFQELFKLMGSGEAEQQTYLLNWLAHLVQKPFDLPGVALIISGLKGCGKDTLFDFLLQFVIGQDYSFNYGSNEQFFDSHDTGRQGKFLCKLEEANRGICLRNADKLKSLITNTTEVFNPKCQKAICFPNYNRFVFTTNGACPVEMSDGERRFVIVQCSPARVGDRPFWDSVRRDLFTPEAGIAVGKFLASIDISGFNPRILPASSFQNAIVEAEKTSEQLFVEQWDGEATPATEFFNSYILYCQTNSLSHCKSSSSLGIRLLSLIRDRLLVKNRLSSGFVYAKP